MRGAFVVQLGSETRPAEVGFEGWVEEDDSYTEQQLVLRIWRRSTHRDS